MINEAVDNLFKNKGEDKSACEAEIENISIDAYRNVALERLRYNQIKIPPIIPHEFMYPPDDEVKLARLRNLTAKCFNSGQM